VTKASLGLSVFHIDPREFPFHGSYLQVCGQRNPGMGRNGEDQIGEGVSLLNVFAGILEVQRESKVPLPPWKLLNKAASSSWDTLVKCNESSVPGMA
jgi:hypothetical protein